MLGLIDAGRGAYERATARLAESLQAFRATDDYMGIAGCLESLGGVALGRRDPIRGARILGAASKLREDHNADRDVHAQSMRQPIVAAIRARLGEGAFAVAWAEGRALALDAAVALALEWSEHHGADDGYSTTSVPTMPDSRWPGRLQ
jgi:hypothetical protein